MIRGQYIFQTYADLARDIAEWEPSLPSNIMCVVGIPRGGLPVASMIAQRRNLPVISVDEFLAGSRPWLKPLRRHLGRKVVPAHGVVLVVDDTACRGGTMAKLRPSLDAVGVPYKTAVPYCTPKARNAVDYVFKNTPHEQQTYEWSLFHDYYVDRQAYDLDGVICQDWDRYDTGDNLADYERHIADAACLNRPTHKVGLIATARVEKYREQTEAWLAKHGIAYKALAMMPYESNEERWRASGGNHHQFAGRWKAAQAKSAKSLLFVESSDHQARVIAESGLSVLAWPSLNKHNILTLERLQ